MVCNPIQSARRARGMSREELGKRLGVSGRTVSYWESWKKIPDPDHTAQLQKELSLSELDTWRVSHRATDRIVQAVSTSRRRIW